MGKAETAFQHGVATGNWEYGPERAARTWNDWAFQAGQATQLADDMVDELWSELIRSGLSKEEAMRWNPEDVSGLQVGDQLSAHGPPKRT